MPQLPRQQQPQRARRPQPATCASTAAAVTFVAAAAVASATGPTVAFRSARVHMPATMPAPGAAAASPAAVSRVGGSGTGTRPTKHQTTRAQAPCVKSADQTAAASPNIQAAGGVSRPPSVQCVPGNGGNTVIPGRPVWQPIADEDVDEAETGSTAASCTTLIAPTTVREHASARDFVCVESGFPGSSASRQAMPVRDFVCAGSGFPGCPAPRQAQRRLGPPAPPCTGSARARTRLHTDASAVRDPRLQPWHARATAPHPFHKGMDVRSGPSPQGVGTVPRVREPLHQLNAMRPY